MLEKRPIGISRGLPRETPGGDSIEIFVEEHQEKSLAASLEESLEKFLEQFLKGNQKHSLPESL